MLLSGATLLIPPDAVVSEAGALSRYLANESATLAFAPTPLAEQLIREPLGSSTSLRALLTGGDLFRPATQDDPGLPVFDHYGPTEASVVTTATGPLAAPWASRSLGRPISGVRVYVLDEGLEPVPFGVAGELFIAGAGVAWGYIGDTALTAERFLPDPFAKSPGDRMYRSGDLARVRRDGHLVFAGRADSQISLRGYRIEPGEIEAVILGYPAISGAVVALTRSPTNSPVLAAYLVYRDGWTAVDERRLRTHARNHLPRHMIPTAFHVLPAFPLTASGKIARDRLPSIQPQMAEPTSPRTELEQTITDIWRESMDATEIGIHDDFFALGGHSINASRIVSRTSATFGIDVAVRLIFEHRTVAEFSAVVEHIVTGEIDAMSADEIESALEEWSQE